MARSMRRVACICAAVSLAMTSFAAEYGWELASELATLKAVLPGEHRILEDGTWDSYSLGEKMDFVHRLTRKAARVPDSAEADEAHRRHVDKILAFLDRTKDPDKFERTYTVRLLLSIETANEALEIPRIAGEGGQQALLGFIGEQERKLQELRQKHPSLDLPTSVLPDSTEGPANAEDRSSSGPFPGNQ